MSKVKKEKSKAKRDLAKDFAVVSGFFGIVKQLAEIIKMFM